MRYPSAKKFRAQYCSLTPEQALKAYTATAGGAGSSFGLIAIGALVNASLNRKRDDRIRDEDRTAVAATLYEELKGLYRTFMENAQHLIDHPPDAIPRQLAQIGQRPLLRAAVLVAIALAQQHAGGESGFGTVSMNIPESNHIPSDLGIHYVETTTKAFVSNPTRRLGFRLLPSANFGLTTFRRKISRL